MAGLKDVEQIQRKLANVQRDIKSTLKRYQSASGSSKQTHVEKLKKLQVERKKLDAKLEAAIEAMHTGAELEDLDEISQKSFRRAETLVSQTDLKNFEVSATNMAEDLYEDGFDEGEIVGYLKGVVLENVLNIAKQLKSMRDKI